MVQNDEESWDCFTKIWCFWQLLFASEARRISVDLLLSSITSSQLLMERLFSNPELVSWTRKLLCKNTLTIFPNLIHHHSHVGLYIHSMSISIRVVPSTTSIPQEDLQLLTSSDHVSATLPQELGVYPKTCRIYCPFWLGDLRSCGVALSFCEDILRHSHDVLHRRLITHAQSRIAKRKCRFVQ